MSSAGGTRRYGWSTELHHFERSPEMTTRETAPKGAPCWTDLWTSDVEAARRFYTQLFGWEAQEPDPGHGGYFMFARDGVPGAGGMGPMSDGPPPRNSWTPYFATADIAKTVEV